MEKQNVLDQSINRREAEERRKAKEAEEAKFKTDFPGAYSRIEECKERKADRLDIELRSLTYLPESIGELEQL